MVNLSLFGEMTDHGWVEIERRRHWAEASGLVCGLEPEAGVYKVQGQDPQVWPDNQPGMCPQCRTLLLIRQHGLALRVGQRVVSRELGMTLYGTVRALFLDYDGVPHCDLTRFWVGRARDDLERQERRESADFWFRSARLCTPYPPKGAPT